MPQPLTNELLQQHTVGEEIGTVEFDEQEAPYYLTHPDMPERAGYPTLRLHVGFSNQGHLFISEAVPAEFRPYILWHELRCRQLGGAGTTSCCCAQASAEELERVPADILGDYVEFRIRMFEALVDLFGPGNDTFRQNLRLSLAFWQERTAGVLLMYLDPQE